MFPKRTQGDTMSALGHKRAFGRYVRFTPESGHWVPFANQSARGKAVE
jgi:hypothetical protein